MDMIGIGMSAVRIAQAALSTTGNNIANANSEGYVRRRVGIREVPSTVALQRLYGVRDMGGGVKLSGVERLSDGFAVVAERRAGTALNEARTVARWAIVAEEAAGPATDDIGAAIGQVFANADAAQAQPGSEAARLALESAVDGTLQRVESTIDALTQARLGIRQELEDQATRLNDARFALDEVNRALTETPPGTAGQAALFDQRDALIDRMADLAGVAVQLDQHGRASVSSNGVPLTGTVAVVGDPPGLTINGNAWQPEGGAMAGALGADAVLAAQARAVTALARSFASEINAWAGQSVVDGARHVRDLPMPATGYGRLADRRATLESGWQQIIGQAAALSASAADRVSMLGARHDAAAAMRDDGEGVDLDREAADLVRYQQAYDGGARILRVAQETFQTIVELFR